MTESDVLTRAARALREAHTGEREGSGFTRARIMNTLHRERRRRTLRWAIFSPIASLLVVGSAWAQGSGKWPVIWKAVASVFVAAPAPPSEPAPARSTRRENATPGRAELPPPNPANVIDAGAEALIPPELPPLATGEAGRDATPAVPQPRARKPARLRRAPRAEQPSSAAEPKPSVTQPRATQPEPAQEREPERDRELGRFRAAHDLHFKGQPRAAIQAYARYLREFPDGRFVPEARYAMALDHIELGNEAAAREALEPFAAGRYGNYRQREARKLLDALEKQSAGAR